MEVSQLGVGDVTRVSHEKAELERAKSTRELLQLQYQKKFEDQAQMEEIQKLNEELQA